MIVAAVNLEAEILKEHSKRNTLRLARWIGSDSARFALLMDLFLKGEYRVTQRSAWIVAQCADNHPQLILPYLHKMIERMLEPGVHVAVKRNVVRILQRIEIPKKLVGKVATVCFDLLASQKEPIAVRCFSMTVLANIAKQEPDLTNEIRLLIEQQMPWGSAGFRARGRKILTQLSR
jgi:hypothetical protein